ncbi:MAG: hypothetical protein IT374_02795 [Polyangiaceae bacterium]|nr:hypothetical protein [Polyangiaceae bacterium]
MRPRAWPAVVSGLALAAAGGSAALARPSVFEAGGEPVSVTAERLEADLSGKTVSLSGAVTLRRGELSLRAPRVEARLRDGGQVAWARASGGVRLEHQGSHAEAEEVEVDLADRRVELRGRVVVGRGASRVEAERATLDLATSRLSLSQVRGTLAPPAASSAAP